MHLDWRVAIDLVALVANDGVPVDVRGIQPLSIAPNGIAVVR